MNSSIKKPVGYAACFGKSTIPKDDPDYGLIKEMIRLLVRNNIGVVQGGYAGGAMGAADEAAVEEATRLQKDNPNGWSIGVPVSCFEEGWGPTTEGTRVNAVNTVEERLQKMAELSDFYVVLPRGGTGTAYELIHFLLRSSYFETTPKPMIVYGKHWRTLLDTFFALCDTSDTTETYPWLYLVTTLKEFEEKVRMIVTQPSAL